MAGRIFINYRRVESLKDAQYLKTLFAKTFGAKRVFLDLGGIDGGANWLQALERQVGASDAMVVLIGKDWANLKDEQGSRRLDNPNDYVRFEISQALLRNLPIVPVSIDGAPIPKPAQLPDSLIPLTLFQAMPLRSESFAPDAEAIAERLRAVLSKLRPRGVPPWGMGLGLAVALAAGVAAGPMVLNQLGAPFLDVVVPGDAQLRAELDAARRRVAEAETAAKAAEARFAEAERAAKSADAAREPVSQRLAAVEKERNSLVEAVAAAEKERDDARNEVASANAKATGLERQLAQILTSIPPSRDCSDCPELIVVPAGRFLMGSPRGEPSRGDNEDDGNGNQVGVAIPNPLVVGRFAVTRGEFAAFIMETSRGMEGGCNWRNGSVQTHDPDRSWRSPPGFEQTDRHPVICVNLEDAKAYVNWLSKKAGKSYRLLSEAEWEYATRAGTTTPFWWGYSISTSQANYNGNYTYGSGSNGENRQKTLPVDTFPPNPWGLYQVHGNVWEWVEDCYHKSYSNIPDATKDGAAPWITGCAKMGAESNDDVHVLRGGSWYDDPRYLRSASRLGLGRELRNNRIGFRVARML
jgi:formylglycine-generating enzyme required for sulfatase activity